MYNFPFKILGANRDKDAEFRPWYMFPISESHDYMSNQIEFVIATGDNIQ